MCGCKDKVKVNTKVDIDYTNSREKKEMHLNVKYFIDKT
jgi:hypothetical protein